MFKYLTLIAFFFIPLITFGQVSIPEWVKDIGGSGSSSSVPSNVITDKQNNIYVSGLFSGTVDFDPSAGVTNLTSFAGSFDIYVAKYTTAGALIWAKQIGGSGTDQVTGNLRIDANGNLAILGQYTSPSIDADPGSGIFTLLNAGDMDCFLIRLDSNGNFLWAKTIGGTETEYSYHLTIDPAGNTIITAKFLSTSVNLGNITLNKSGNENGMVIKYSSTGTLLWAFKIGQSGNNSVSGITADSDNNIIISGGFSGNNNFNPLGTAHILNGNSSSSFIAKYTGDGILIWVTPINGSVVNHNMSLCLDSENNPYMYGTFASALTFSPNSTITPVGGNQNTFLARYNKDGTHIWAKSMGGTGNIYSYGLVMSQDDYIYCSGYFTGNIDFNPSPTATSTLTSKGGGDLFMVKVSKDGIYQWAFNAGNNSCTNTVGRNLTIDGNNDVLLAGTFCSTVNFDASKCSTFNLTAQSQIRDTFLAKYVQSMASSGLQITFFSIPQQVSSPVIDHIKLQITVTVSKGTNLGALVPTIATSTNTTLSPASGSPQDFNQPVIYSLQTNCNSLNYTVNVIYDSDITTCSGSFKILNGDAVAGSPTSFTWEQELNSVWMNAPGVINQKDYQTSSLINNTGSDINVKLRRKVVTQGVVTFDSHFNVNIQPVINITNNNITAPSITSFCTNGNPSTINGSVPIGGNSSFVYQWQESSNNTTFKDVIGAVSKDFDPPSLTTTTYYRRVVTSGACVSLSMSNTITISILPVLSPPLLKTSATTICEGDKVTISVDSPQSGLSYNWYNTASKNTLLFTGTTFTTSLTSTTKFFAESYNGSCFSTLSDITINTNSAPAPPVISNIEICPGNSATLTANPSNSNIDIKWYNSVSNGTLLHEGNTYITSALNNETIFYAEAVNNNNCRSLTRTVVKVQIYPQLSAPNISVGAVTSSSITFKWLPINGAINYSISLNKGQTFVLANGTDGLSHTVGGLKLGETVTILVHANGSEPCQESEDSEATNTLTANTIFVPNAFTPNADGNNDILYVYGNNIKNLKFNIYNQWGELLFNTQNHLEGWDGTFKGNPEAVGVYVYSLEVVCNNEEKINKKGTITLVR